MVGARARGGRRGRIQETKFLIGYSVKEYFMSQEQQDEALGKLIRERRETQQRLGAMTADAKELGKHLVNVGNALQGPIEAILVNTDGSPIMNRGNFVVVTKLIEIETLRKLVSDYKNIKQSLAAIETNLKALGHSGD
jgi:hypothetical protein